jgi:hypothetical protein
MFLRHAGNGLPQRRRPGNVFVDVHDLSSAWIHGFLAD